MDFLSILILGSILFFSVLLTVGPIMELKGKILFEKPKREPVLKGRYGMGLMVIGFLLFLIALVLRSVFSSETVTPMVMSGYALWIVGGIVSVARNEALAILVPKDEKRQ